jgi:DNA-binding transcriptional LysR family regulator
MDIQDLRIFARVAAVQNLSAVGTELGLTPGTISKRLQALESELRVRLFDRTTRSIRITDEGTTFLTHVERILLDLENARASVGDNLTRPKGKLKISAPASFGRLFVAPAICSFMRAYPDIEVQIDLTDRVVNLQAEGYDAAIRIGVVSDSGLAAKRLTPDQQVVVAAPEYLEVHGRPQTPHDLANHNCFVLGDNWQWTFARNGESFCITRRSTGRVCCKPRSCACVRISLRDGWSA